MKKALLLFTLYCLPFLAISQQQNIGNFHLEGNVFQWRNVFMPDTLNSRDIQQNAYTYLSTAKGLSNIQINGNIISGELKDYQVDFKKYGGRSSNVILHLLHPISGKFTIEFKENRYRVTVANVVFNLNSGSRLYQANVPLVNVATRKKGTEISSNALLLRSLEYMNLDFMDKFALPSKNEEW